MPTKEDRSNGGLDVRLHAGPQLFNPFADEGNEEPAQFSFYRSAIYVHPRLDALLRSRHACTLTANFSDTLWLSSHLQ
jgi:hypothetical protein